jgi:hypothetical protein
MVSAVMTLVISSTAVVKEEALSQASSDLYRKTSKDCEQGVPSPVYGPFINL